VEHYIWLGGVTAMVLHFDPVGKVGYLTLVSKGILTEQKAWERAQATKAKGAS
jgi:energy-converting hydrogenase Eha subunit C